MAAEKSPASVALEKISRKQKNLKKKILRAEESGDIARLLLYRLELEKIGEELGRLSVDCAVVAKDALPILRRSYSQEFFSEAILTGRTTRRRLERSTYYVIQQAKTA